MRFLKEAGHRRWRQDLSSYLDGRLDTSRRYALERHLAGCAYCQEELASLRRVVALLHRVPQVEAPRSFTLAKAPSATLRWPLVYGRSLQYATAVAAMLLLAVVVGDLATSRSTAVSPANQGTATSIQGKAGPLGPREPEATHTAAATAAPLAGGQDLAQATPTQQLRPFAASEKAQETDTAVPLSTTPNSPGTLHNWFRWGKIATGALLAALVSMVSVHSWLGRRRKHS